jgi:hypothetical protein
MRRDALDEQAFGRRCRPAQVTLEIGRHGLPFRLLRDSQLTDARFAP